MPIIVYLYYKVNPYLTCGIKFALGLGFRLIEIYG